jgi:hypothetical protein
MHCVLSRTFEARTLRCAVERISNPSFTVFFNLNRMILVRIIPFLLLHNGFAKRLQALAARILRMRLDVNYSRRQAWIRCHSSDRIGFLASLDAAQVILKAVRPLVNALPGRCLIPACGCHKEQHLALILPVSSGQPSLKHEKHVMFEESTCVQFVPNRHELTLEQQDGMYWSARDLQEMRKNYFLWAINGKQH